MATYCDIPECGAPAAGVTLKISPPEIRFRILTEGDRLRSDLCEQHRRQLFAQLAAFGFTPAEPADPA